MKARAGFLAGLLAAMLAALPVVPRFEPSLRGQAFFVCTAGCALVSAPLAAALTRSTASTFRSALVLGTLLAAVVLIPFAGLLKTATHHRPLGGVTFAVIGGLAIAGLSLLSGRLIALAAERNGRVHALARFAVVALAALGAAAVLRGLLYGVQAGSAYRIGFFDALRVLGLAAVASRVSLPAGVLRRLRGFGLAAWVLVVTVGVCLGRAPAMQAELESVCPVLYWPLVWLGG